MVIVAHPDDMEFLCAGTIARWVRDGAVGAYVLCTSGQVGIKNPALTMEEVAAIREREQREAAAVVGVEDVTFLGYQDGILENTMDLRRRLVREIRRFRPEVLIIQDPTRLFVERNDYINHPDHRAAAGAAIDAVFPAAGMPHVFREFEAEGLTAHETRKVYVVAFEESNTWVDISDTLDLKLEALMKHDSQIKEMGDWDPRIRIREWAERHARGKEMTYAEGYRVITLKSPEDWQRCKGHVLPEDCPEQPYTDAHTPG